MGDGGNGDGGRRQVTVRSGGKRGWKQKQAIGLPVGLGIGPCCVSGSGRDEAAGAAQFLARLCVVPRVNLRPPAFLPENPGI